MKRVLTAVVLIPFVLLVVFRAPLWLFAVAIACLIVATLHEYLGIAGAAELKPFKWLCYVFILLPFVLQWINGWPPDTQYRKISFGSQFLGQWESVLMVSPVVFGIPLVFRKELREGMASVAASILGVIYIGVSLSLLVCLRADAEILVIFVLFSVWAGDIAAYYVGRSAGKHKLAPVVSPGKSWEGAIASVFASIGFAFLVFRFQGQINSLFLAQPWPIHPLWLEIAGLGLVTNIAAQFGDLFESALKRGAGLKDSGTLLPGHGGILDRIDALLFAVPAVWYYANFTGFLKH